MKGLDRDALKVSVADTVRVAGAQQAGKLTEVNKVKSSSKHEAAKNTCSPFPSSFVGALLLSQVQLFSYFDADGDGELSLAEFMRLLQDSLPIVYGKSTLTVEEDMNVTNAGHGGD